jgi:hypothetical protein
MSAQSVTPQYLWDINHGLLQILTKSDAKGTALNFYGLARTQIADPPQGTEVVPVRRPWKRAQPDGSQRDDERPVCV